MSTPPTPLNVPDAAHPFCGAAVLAWPLLPPALPGIERICLLAKAPALLKASWSMVCPLAAEETLSFPCMALTMVKPLEQHQISHAIKNPSGTPVHNFCACTAAACSGPSCGTGMDRAQHHLLLRCFGGPAEASESMALAAMNPIA